MSPVPFSAWVDRCLFDSRFGYYARGVVRFGDEGHFSTFPQRLSPGFGWMVADAVAWLLAEPMASGAIPPDVPITLLELGGGDGHLARDTLDRLLSSQADPRLGPLARRVRYVVGERSPALRRRQAERLAPHVAAGRADVVAMDARFPTFDGPSHGVVLCTELLDLLACDKLRIAGPGGVEQVQVQTDPVMEAESLWDALAAKAPPVLSEVTLPLDPDPDLVRHLAAVAPLVRDLAALDLLPTFLYYGAGLPGFVDGLAGILRAPGSWGLALIVDYGGTSRHLLDPRVRHLRTYGRADVAHAEAPYVSPGDLDITWDVDFSEPGRLAGERGLRMCHFGHQAVLESAAADLWGPRLRPLLVAGREAEGATTVEDAELEAERLVFAFREADGFRSAILGPPGYEAPSERFGPSDAWEHDRLVTVLPAADETLRRVLDGLDLPDPAPWLRPGCDVVAQLSTLRHYAERADVLARLERAGLLAGPGGLWERRQGPDR